jgi:tRNA-dihydrouridine synthase B
MSATSKSTKSLTDPFRIGTVEIPNRVLLAPLAGIGNWFVRLQARRFGAGLAVSEMVSSFALHHGNRRTMLEMLRIDPAEHPVSVQLFGQDPEVMRSAAAIVAEAGADLIDINMGCPVRKVCKTGAGAALLREPDRAVTIVRAAREGSGLPVTVKLRSGVEAGDRSGFQLALRLAGQAGAAAIGFHPRPAESHHSGAPDYELAAELAELLNAASGVPLIISGGLHSAERARLAFERSRADAVMIARGALGYPWIFSELTGRRETPPVGEEIIRELIWVIDRGAEHFGPERAARNLRKLYPWYLERLGITGERAHAYQRTESLDQVRELLAETTVGTIQDAAAAAL